MPNEKKPQYRYNSMGGINNKVNPYLNNEMEFLNIENMDFQQPGSLSKRWGSTQYFGQSLSGKIVGAYEFIQTIGFSASPGTSYFYVIGGNTLGLATNGGFSSIFHGNSGGNSYFLGYGSSGVDRLTIGNSLNADFDTIQNQCFLSNQKDFLKTTNGLSFYFFGLPRFQAPNANVTNALIGSSGVDTGFSGTYYYKFAWINSYGMAGAPSESFIGISLFQLYRLAFNTIGCTSITFSLMGISNPDIGFSTANALVPPNYDITSIGVFRAGPLPESGLSTGPGYVSVFSQFLPTYGITAGYSAANNFEYTYVGSMGVTSGSVVSTFVDTNPQAGVTFLNTAILPWNWYLFPERFFTPNGISAYFLSNTTGFGVTTVPQMVEVYGNRLFMSGMTLSPSTLWYSEFDEPEHFEPDFNFDVKVDDGLPVTALKAYNGNLIVFKLASFHQLTGDDPTNFVLNEISSEYGCLSNRAVAEYNDLLVFLDVKGIIKFNGANIEILSTKIDPIFHRMNISSARVNAGIVYDKQRNQILVDIPVDNSITNNLTVVWDIVNNAFTTYKGYNPSISLVAQGQLSTQTIFYGGYSGLLEYFGSSFTSDNGVGYTCVAKSGFCYDMGYSIEKLFRRLYTDTTPQGTSAAPSVLDVNLYQDYGASIVFSSTLSQAPFQTKLECGVPARALSVEYVMGSTFNLTLHGFTIEYRFLRSI